jgi:hypothetical protein
MNYNFWFSNSAWGYLMIFGDENLTVHSLVHKESNVLNF